MRKKILAAVLALCLVLSPITVFADAAGVTYEYIKNGQRAAAGVPEISCKAAYIADPVSGKVFYEKRAHEKMYPASTTKILTALVVLENCDLNETATVSQKAIDMVPWDGSSAYLMAGEEFSVYVLLQALLIRSANEAANALAEHVSGSVEAFAELCNERAKELGCEKLHFVNPNGLHDSDHYCTAYDLFLIARECQKYDVFNEIVSTKYFTVPGTSVYQNSDRTFKNTNKMIMPQYKNYYYPYCTGIKTGNTTPAGRCLVASCTKDDMELICVVMGGEFNEAGLSERYLDSAELFDYVYGNYSYQTIDEKGGVKATIRVKKATRKTAELDVITGTDITGILPNGYDKSLIINEINIDDALCAPIAESQAVGTITYTADGVKYTAELLASHAVEKSHFATGILIALLITAAIAVIVLIITMRIKKPKAKAIRIEK